MHEFNINSEANRHAFQLEATIRDCLYLIRSHNQLPGKHALVEIQDEVGNPLSLLVSKPASKDHRLYHLHLQSSRKILDGCVIPTRVNEHHRFVFDTDEPILNSILNDNEDAITRELDAFITYHLNNVIKANRNNKVYDFFFSLVANMWQGVNISYPNGMHKTFHMNSSGGVFERGLDSTGRIFDLKEIDGTPENFSRLYSKYVGSQQGEIVGHLHVPLVLKPISYFSDKAFKLRRGKMMMELLKMNLLKNGYVLDGKHVNEVEKTIYVFVMEEKRDTSIHNKLEEIVQSNPWLTWFRDYTNHVGRYPFKKVPCYGDLSVTLAERFPPMIFGGISHIILKEDKVKHYLPPYAVGEMANPFEFESAFYKHTREDTEEDQKIIRIIWEEISLAFNKETGHLPLWLFEGNYDMLVLWQYHRLAINANIRP